MPFATYVLRMKECDGVNAPMTFSEVSYHVVSFLLTILMLLIDLESSNKPPFKLWKLKYPRLFKIQLA